MPVSKTFLVKNMAEFRSISEINLVPPNTRGIYVLYNAIGKHMEVVYVGMARGEKSGVRSRLNSHRRKKVDKWTHFSVFEVWDNISKQQVEELEGLFRQIYSRGKQAQELN